MWQFSEAFMEDCIVESPAAFLGDGLHLVARQPTVAGIRPDLVFSEADSSLVVVEIQQKALDRQHVYKALAYRDLLQDETPDNPVRVIVVCESIVENHAKIADVYNIEIISIERSRFIEIAAHNCPQSITKHLTKPDQDYKTAADKSLNAPVDVSEALLQIEPLDWHDHIRPHTVLAHLYKELGRLSLEPSDLPARHYELILSECEQSLGAGAGDAVAEIGQPHRWNIGKLGLRVFPEPGKIDRSEIYRYLHGQESRKPKIRVSAFLTQMNNLSVRWSPTEFDDGDWLYWPTGSTYGWQRPDNEIMFIHDARSLSPSSIPSRYDQKSRHVIDGIFVGLVVSCFRNLLQVLGQICDVRVENDFEIVTEPFDNAADEWNTKNRIVGWKLYNVQGKLIEEERTWIENFEKTYGLSIKEFVQIFDNAIRDRRSSEARRTHYASQDLKKLGFEMNPAKVEQVMRRIDRWNSGDLYR